MRFAKVQFRVAKPLRLRFATLRPLASVFVLLITLVITGCGGKPFDIRERPFKIKEGREAPLVNVARAKSDQIEIEAEAIRDEDYLYETFNANLILAGVLPIRLELVNQGQEPVDLSKAQFEIKAADGRRYKMADAKKAFKRLISYYEISTYSKSGYKKSQEDFASYSLDFTKPLGAGESREGLVFFIIPDAIAQTTGVTMAASRLDRKQSKSATVELRLN
ncbi:MAG TPA: hypothetical protein VLR90_09340 [Blastocatellia bacterium]|nr:hypothetical protein [Blastocatellia bacterium]